MLWYPIAGAGLSAVGTLASVLAFSLPYWIQLQKDIDATGNGVTDVSMTFTHGLWRYCNLVTTNSERTENCGENQSHSDSDQATGCLLCLAIILSINVVVQTVLYMSRFPLMSGENVSLYIATGSAIIASLLVTAGLVVYGISDHNIRITDTLRLESSAASLYACFWLAAAGAIFIASSVPLLLLTAWTNIRTTPDKATGSSIGSLGSLLSSGSSTKSYDNFSFRTKFSDYPERANRDTSAEEYSSDEDERAPPPYIPDDVVKVSSLADIPLPIGVKLTADDNSDSDSDDVPPKPGAEGDDASVRKLAAIVPESDRKYNIDERLDINPEALEDNEEFSNRHNDMPDYDEELGEKLVVELSHDKDEANSADYIPTDETNQETISVELADQEMLDMPLFGIDEEDEPESADDEAAGTNQFLVSGQQVGTPRRFGMTPVETTSRSLQRQSSNLSSNSAFKYLIQHVSSENIAGDTDPDAAQPLDYPLSFEESVEPARPPTDTRGLFIPVVLSSEKKSLFKLPHPPEIGDQSPHPKPKMPKKPVFFNAASAKTAYGGQVGTIPQYPAVSFRKRKHVTTKPKKKKVPTFKESIRFKKDFKTLPPPPPGDSEC